MKNEPNRININLFDGTEILGKKLPPHPFHNPATIAFFESDEILSIIPMVLVKRINMYFEEETE